MIPEIVAHLKADTALMALLSSSCAVGPDVARRDIAAPYMVYRLQSDAGRNRGNVAREAAVGFSIYAATFAQADQIVKRMDALLDKDEDHGIAPISSRIHSVWRTGGSSTFEVDTKLYHRALVFAVIYTEA